MKRRVFFLTGAMLVMANPLFAEDIAAPTLHGEYLIQGAVHRTGGSGDQTLMRKGNFYLDELKLRLDAPVPLMPGWLFDTDLDVRQTDDPQVDKRKNPHLLGVTSDLYNEITRFTFGDFYGDFTQYTLQQKVTGAQAEVKTDTFELKGAGGRLNEADDQRFARYVGAGRVEALVLKQGGPFSDLRLGANFSDAEDDHSSFDTTTGIPDESNRVGSINTTFTFNDITEVDGELAKSWTDPDTTLGNTVDRATGTALRASTYTKFSRMTKLRMNYEWVSSDFATLGGSAVSDRVNFNTRLDHRFTREWQAEGSYRMFFDKLDKSALNKRTLTQAPHLGLNWTPDNPVWGLEDFSSRWYWDERRRASNDDPSGQIDYTSDEVGVEDEFTVKRVVLTSGASWRREDDDFDPTNNRQAYTGSLGFRMREKLFSAKASPYLRWEADYEGIPKEDGHDLSQNWTWGLDLDFLNGARFEQRYTVGHVDRLLYDADTTKFTAHWLFEYKLPTKEDLTWQVSYDELDFVHPQATQRFAERNFQTQLLWKF